jgi:hypothetical protein
MRQALALVMLPWLPVDSATMPHAIGDAPMAMAALLEVGDAQRAAADAFAGRYRFVGGQRQREAVTAAIEGVVAEMNPLARAIARNRLVESNPVPDAIDIRRREDTIEVKLGERSYVAPLDESQTSAKGVNGDTLRYHVELDGPELRQVFVGERGRRENTLHRRGPQRLELNVVVKSEQLPKPLTYRLTFERR